MAQRGYPGIHAGIPTTQRLRSALVVNGAYKIKSKIKSKSKSEAALRPTSLAVAPRSNCRSEPARDGGGANCI